MTPLRPKILLAEDNDLSLQLLSRALETSGFQVIQCCNGREALAKVGSDGPELLLVDYDMPDLTGAQVCEQIRGNPNRTIATLPIILLTAHTGPTYKTKSLQAGANEFVTKPVDLLMLTSRIETHLRLHALQVLQV